MSEVLYLNWNNHAREVVHKLQNLHFEELFRDATIVCRDKFFPVHRILLSSCSDYFKEIFKRTPCQHPFIVMNDFTHSHLEALLDYMYKGEANVSHDCLYSLIKAAEVLKIRGFAVPEETYHKESDSDSDSVKLEELSDKDSQSINGTPCKSKISAIKRNYHSLNKKDNQCSESLKWKTFEKTRKRRKFKDSSDINTYELQATFGDERGSKVMGVEVKSEKEDVKEEREDMSNIQQNSSTIASTSKNEAIFVSCYTEELKENNTGNSPPSSSSQEFSWNERPRNLYRTTTTSAYPLPKFSMYVQPYLKGTAVGPQLEPLRNHLIDEIIDYLDCENLLNSKNKIQQSWGSRRLQRVLLNEYPNIVKEQSKRKGELGLLMSRVLERRRKRKCAKE